jgi:hypothetical protein
MEKEAPAADESVRPTPGMLVKSRFNEAWGAGTVLAVQGGRARVLFASHPDKKPVTAPCRSLVVTRAGQWVAAAEAAAAPEPRAVKAKPEAKAKPEVKAKPEETAKPA